MWVPVEEYEYLKGRDDELMELEHGPWTSRREDAGII